jgi:hypothetical protein
MSQLDDRYFVFKRSDVNECLTREEKKILQRLATRIGMFRAQRGASPSMPCLVVEADWPEFASTQQALLQRVSVEKALRG